MFYVEPDKTYDEHVTIPLVRYNDLLRFNNKYKEENKLLKKGIPLVTMYVERKTTCRGYVFNRVISKAEGFAKIAEEFNILSNKLEVLQETVDSQKKEIASLSRVGFFDKLKWW
jgi:hypothetical protein